MLLKDKALSMLEQEIGSFAALISKFFKQHSDFFSIADLWNLFQTTSKKEVKIRVLSLINRMRKWSKWTKFLYLLKASEENSQEILAHVEKQLTQWVNTFNNSYSLPTEQEIDQIHRALAKSQFKPTYIAHLKRWLNHFI
jgi:hypothetical protein